MRERPLTASECHTWLEGLRHHPDEWWESFDNQIEVLDTTSYFEKLLSPPLRRKVIDTFAQSVKIPRERVEAIFRLDKKEDIRRAIQWPGALPVERAEPGSQHYPTEGWLAEYLHYTQGSEIPMAWHFWFGVALIGAACRRNLYIDMGTWYVYPYWYLMVIEQTASAKSTAFSIAKSMLSRSNRIVEKAGRLDALVQVASPSSSLPAFLDKIKSTSYYIPQADGTSRQGMTESCVVVPVDELVTLLGKKNFDSTQWVQFLTALFGYTDEVWTDSKVVKGERVLFRPAISFWGGSTLTWIKEHVTEEMFQGGFLGRFVFIKRRGDEKVVAFPPPLDPIWAESLAEYLARLQMKDLMEFKLAPNVKGWIDEWYKVNKATTLRWEGDAFQAYWRRKQSHLMRLVMCMAVADGRLSATDEDCDRALKIFELEEDEMGWIFSDLGAHPDKHLCDYLLQVIESRRGVPFPLGELMQRTRSKIGNRQILEKLLQTLVLSGEVEWTKGKHGGMQYTLKRPIRRAPPQSTGKVIPGILGIEPNDGEKD